MRLLSFLLFFSVFFAIYIAGNYYIFIRGWQSLPTNYWIKFTYTTLFLIASLSFIACRFTGHTSLFMLNHVLTWIGSFWLAAAVYFLFSVVLIDIIRLFNSFLHFLPSQGSENYMHLKIVVFSGVVILVSIIMLAGHINAIHPQVKRLDIAINKVPVDSKILKIVAVSDIHLGTLVGKKRLEKLASLVNNENPDLILLAGDLLDEVQEPILRENIGEPLRKLKAKYGIYAIPGNHEYIGGINKAVKYITSLDIPVLRDTVVNVNEQITLIGRDDLSSHSFAGGKRKSLKEIIGEVDYSKTLILLDHQPYNLKEAEECKMDLQISGHTHDGQFWPFNYIVDGVYELAYGYKIRGNTQYYVSSGYGTWGPPVRIANKPEIVVLNLIYK